MRYKFILLLIILFLLFIFISADIKGLKIVEQKGNEGIRWAICIGINDYWDDKIVDLNKARNDAKIIGKLLNENGQFNKVFIMSDDLNPKDNNYPSKFNIEANINYIVEMADAKDLVVFHFSGHGVSNKDGESYLITTDTRLDALFSTSIKVDNIVKKLKNKGLKKILFLIDACRESVSETKSVVNNKFNEKIYSESDLAAAFYATKQGWFSYEDPDSDYGIFSRFIAEGLSGMADLNKDGLITFSELEQYVTIQIYDYAIQRGLKQKPYTKIYGEKFGDLALTIVNSDNLNLIKNEKSSSDDLIYVEGGVFQMGNSTNDDNINEKPVHSVNLDSFWIGKYEVTFGEFKEFIKSAGYITVPELTEGGWIWNGVKWIQNKEITWNNPNIEQNDKHPVVVVSWYDCIEYCNWKSRERGLTPYYNIDKKNSDNNNKNQNDVIKWTVSINTGADGYRLPTEAEWEYAARGGKKSKGYKYSGGNIIDEIGWYSANTKNNGTSETGKKNPNELGIYDMSGNVFEWCRDWYGDYTADTQNNPVGPQSGSSRIGRGGSWLNLNNYLRITYRTQGVPCYGDYNVGFRLARPK